MFAELQLRSLANSKVIQGTVQSAKIVVLRRSLGLSSK